MFTDEGIVIVCITMKLLVGECLREERCLEMTNTKIERKNYGSCESQTFALL